MAFAGKPKKGLLDWITKIFKKSMGRYQRSILSVRNKNISTKISLNIDNESILSLQFCSRKTSVKNSAVKKIASATKTFNSYLNKQPEKSFFQLCHQRMLKH